MRTPATLLPVVLFFLLSGSNGRAQQDSQSILSDTVSAYGRMITYSDRGMMLITDNAPTEDGTLPVRTEKRWFETAFRTRNEIRHVWDSNTGERPSISWRDAHLMARIATIPDEARTAQPSTPPPGVPTPGATPGTPQGPPSEYARVSRPEPDPVSPAHSYEESPAAPAGRRLSPAEREAIVFVESDTNRGTGFFTRIDGRTFIITNLHVLAGAQGLRFTNHQGERIPVEAIFAGRGHDIALIRTSLDLEGLRIADSSGGDPFDYGDSILVPGNRYGGGVVTERFGEIIGIGPDRIEVDADFQPGNSGSPIINLRDNSVIGVATYMEQITVRKPEATRSGEESDADDLTDVETRWFGYRFDSIESWERLNWSTWQEQNERIAEFYATSDALLAFIRGDRAEYMRHAGIRRLVESLDRSLNENRNNTLRQRDRINFFLRDLAAFSERDVNDFQRREFYDYFRTSQYLATSVPLQLQYRRQIDGLIADMDREIRAWLDLYAR